MKEIVAQPRRTSGYPWSPSWRWPCSSVPRVRGQLDRLRSRLVLAASRLDGLAADPATHTFLLIGVVQPFSATAPAPSVPEPSTWALMIVGFAGVGLSRHPSRWNSDRRDNRIGRAARAQRGWLTREIFAPALRKTESVLGFSCMTGESSQRRLTDLQALKVCILRISGRNSDGARIFLVELVVTH